MLPFTDQSTATRQEKAHRFLQSMADGHNGRYFHNDGWPRSADIIQDAAATLEVFRKLTKTSPNECEELLPCPFCGGQAEKSKYSSRVICECLRKDNVWIPLDIWQKKR